MNVRTLSHFGALLLPMSAVLLFTVFGAACGKAKSELILGSWDQQGGGGRSMTFNKDGSLVESNAGFTMNGGWELSGSDITLKVTTPGSKSEQRVFKSKIVKLDDQLLVLGSQDKDGVDHELTYQRGNVSPTPSKAASSASPGNGGT